MTQTKVSPLARIAAALHSRSFEAIASPPPGPARLVVSIFIAAYVLWQVILPVTYYFGDYKNDERFSWRMFSYLGRLQKQCVITVNEKVFGLNPGNAPSEGLDLELMAGNWVRLLQRGRIVVVEKFLRNRCEQNPYAIDARLVRMCPTPEGGEETPSGEVVFNCKKRALTKNSW